MTKTRWSELEIKAMVLNHLRSQGDISPKAILLSEFNVEKSSRRIDLAWLEGDRFIGLEIKSEADSLTRLHSQTETYLHYFDKVIAVVASKHLFKAMEILPKNVSLWEQRGDTLNIRNRGRTKKNETSKRLIGLMTAKELLRTAQLFDLPQKASSRVNLEQALSTLSPRILRSAAFQALSRRYIQTSNVFWKSVQNRNILPSDIELLSRFREARSLRRLSAESRNIFWSSMQRRTEEDPHMAKLKDLHDAPFGIPPEELKTLLTQ